jgi:hypothetical protein
MNELCVVCSNTTRAYFKEVVLVCGNEDTSCTSTSYQSPVCGWLWPNVAAWVVTTQQVLDEGGLACSNSNSSSIHSAMFNRRNHSRRKPRLQAHASRCWQHYNSMQAAVVHRIYVSELRLDGKEGDLSGSQQSSLYCGAVHQMHHTLH